MQQIFYDFSAFDIYKDKKPLLVCDNAFDFLNIDFPFNYIRFSNFRSNPIYGEAECGTNIFKENNCDSIIAIGGGSSIDTAKCIKYLLNKNIPLLAIPTTSGTGSESTHFAVIYKNGEKISIADKTLLPNYVILQSSVLKTLPLYQKKCTMLDALCQAIESWWSSRATNESVMYSKKAISLILDSMDSYLANEDEGNKDMLIASNFAGKAINITTTTAPHAMSYKLTSLFNISHGHAVALCLPKVWRYMGGFGEIAMAMNKKNTKEAILYLENLLEELEILPPSDVSIKDIELLTNAVNTQRLGNHPIYLNKETIEILYKQILEV